MRTCARNSFLDWKHKDHQERESEVHESPKSISVGRREKHQIVLIQHKKSVAKKNLTRGLASDYLDIICLAHACNKGQYSHLQQVEKENKKERKGTEH